MTPPGNPVARPPGADYRLAMDLIRIDGLELRCIVGLRSYERHREQPIRVDLALGLDLSIAGRSGRISDTADYSRVTDAITGLLRFREYRLLEVAAEEAAAFLFAMHPEVERVQVRIEKPEALAGRARCAAVEIERTRAAFGLEEERTPQGRRVELLRSQEALVEAVTLEPGEEIRFEDGCPRFEWLARGTLADGGQGPFTRAAREVSSYRVAGSSGALLARCVAVASHEAPQA